MSKILVLTGFDDGMIDIGSLTMANQRSYACRHGYDFEVIREYRKESHCGWMLTRL
jgi:hypothetical protein